MTEDKATKFAVSVITIAEKLRVRFRNEIGLPNEVHEFCFQVPQGFDRVYECKCPGCKTWIKADQGVPNGGYLGCDACGDVTRVTLSHG